MLTTDPALLATPRPGNCSRDSCDPIGVVSPTSLARQVGGAVVESGLIGAAASSWPSFQGRRRPSLTAPSADAVDARATTEKLSHAKL